MGITCIWATLNPSKLLQRPAIPSTCLPSCLKTYLTRVRASLGLLALLLLSPPPLAPVLSARALLSIASSSNDSMSIPERSAIAQLLCLPGDGEGWRELERMRENSACAHLVTEGVVITSVKWELNNRTSGLQLWVFETPFCYSFWELGCFFTVSRGRRMMLADLEGCLFPKTRHVLKCQSKSVASCPWDACRVKSTPVVSTGVAVQLAANLWKILSV